MSLRGILVVFACVFLLLGGACASSAAAPEPRGTASGPRVRVELLSEVTSFTPGQTFWVGLHQRISPGWHTYWMKGTLAARRRHDRPGVPVGVLADLRPGTNAIEVVATNKAGKVARETRTVTRVTGAAAGGRREPEDRDPLGGRHRRRGLREQERPEASLLRCRRGRDVSTTHDARGLRA